MNPDGFLRMQSCQVFSQLAESFRIGFDCGDGCQDVCGELQDMAGLAAKSGATVKEMPPQDKRGQQKTDELGGFVLDLEESFCKTGKIMDRAVVVGKNDCTGGMGPCSCSDVFFLKAGAEIICIYR